MVVEEYGVAPTPKSPLLAALNTFAAFMLCGLVPLVTFLGAGGLVPCGVATGVVFFAIGAIKSRWSLTSWWRSGFGTFVIGMSAAALAFGVGFGFRMLFDVPQVEQIHDSGADHCVLLPGPRLFQGDGRNRGRCPLQAKGNFQIDAVAALSLPPAGAAAAQGTGWCWRRWYRRAGVSGSNGTGTGGNVNGAQICLIIAPQTRLTDPAPEAVVARTHYGQKEPGLSSRGSFNCPHRKC